MTAYMKAAVRAAGLLMQAFSVGLDLDPDYFARTYTGEPTVLFRIFCYPAAPPLEGNEAPALGGWGAHRLWPAHAPGAGSP